MTNLQKNLTKSEKSWKKLGGYSEMRILKHTCAVFWDRLVFYMVCYIGELLIFDSLVQKKNQLCFKVNPNTTVTQL